MEHTLIIIYGFLNLALWFKVHTLAVNAEKTTIRVPHKMKPEDLTAAISDAADYLSCVPDDKDQSLIPYGRQTEVIDILNRAALVNENHT